MIVGGVTSHLGNHTARTPVRDAAVAATITRNRVLVADVSTCLDETNHKIDSVDQAIDGAKSNEKNDRFWQGLLDLTIFISHHEICQNREEVIDAKKRDKGDEHDFEGGNACRTIVHGSTEPIQAHAAHDLAQCDWSAPERKAAHGVAASICEAIVATITPGSHRDVLVIRAINGVFGLVNRELGNGAEMLSLLDTTFGLNYELRKTKK